MLTRLLLAVYVATASLRAAELPVWIENVIDLRCNTAPDVVPRFLTDAKAAQAADDSRMRAIVLQNHFVPTADRAQLQMIQQRPYLRIEVFGGIVLNRAVGGLNAEAIRRMMELEGKRGKVVWLPTYDAEHHVAFTKKARPFVSVVRNGQPVPQLTEIFRLIAQYDLVLATGYSSAEESLVLVAAAKQAGVKHVVITDVFSDRLNASAGQLRKFAELGAMMECTWSTTPQPFAVGTIHRLPDVAKCAAALKTVGLEHFVASSEVSEERDPDYIGGLRDFAKALKAVGPTDRDLDIFLRRNPAAVLGLHVIKARYVGDLPSDQNEDVKNHLVHVSGTIAAPGSYVVDENATLRDIWHAAGAPHRVWGRSIVLTPLGGENTFYRCTGSPGTTWLETLGTITVRPGDIIFFTEVE